MSGAREIECTSCLKLFPTLYLKGIAPCPGCGANVTVEEPTVAHIPATAETTGWEGHPFKPNVKCEHCGNAWWISKPPTDYVTCPSCEKTTVFKQDMVNSPSHYGGGDNPLEHVKVAEALGWDRDAFIYNCTKYLWRFGLKPGEDVLKDLRKARWYLDRKIKRLEETRGDSVKP